MEPSGRNQWQPVANGTPRPLMPASPRICTRGTRDLTGVFKLAI
jgi:hypothetical protein